MLTILIIGSEAFHQLYYRITNSIAKSGKGEENNTENLQERKTFQEWNEFGYDILSYITYHVYSFADIVKQEIRYLLFKDCLDEVVEEMFSKLSFENTADRKKYFLKYCAKEKRNIYQVGIFFHVFRNTINQFN
jgi:hypothetical protein